MQQILTVSVAEPRFRTWLLGAFAVLALVLSAAGGRSNPTGGHQGPHYTTLKTPH